MKDQYGKPIPPDLVLLENSEEALKKGVEVKELDWYCVGETGHIFVSDLKVTEILGHHDFVPLNDVYPVLAKGDVSFVDKPLRRWNLKDGFYHA